MKNELMFSSKTDEWETPQEFFDELDREFHFNLDPCANESNHKCDRYFTAEQDGLEQSWKGCRVFCNPPYGKKIGKWVQKAYMEAQQENTLVVLFIPSRTETNYFHDYIYHKAEIRFIRGRIRFGNSTMNAPFPSMLAIFRGPGTDKESAE